jgi:hypothetical protein
MKAIVLLILATLISGCSIEIGKRGAKFNTVTPPPSAIIHARASSIGLTVGQNPATQTPEMVLGYKSVTYDRIPVATSNIYAPSVTSTIGVDAEIGGGITESLKVRNDAKPLVIVTNSVKT